MYTMGSGAYNHFTFSLVTAPKIQTLLAYAGEGASWVEVATRKWLRSWWTKRAFLCSFRWGSDSAMEWTEGDRWKFGAEEAGMDVMRLVALPLTCFIKKTLALAR